MYLVDTNVLSAGAPTKAVARPGLVVWMDRNSGGLYLGLPGVTWGATREEALRQARDLLVTALSICADEGRATPAPGAAYGRPMVSTPAADAAKMALHDAMLTGGISNVELARRLGVTETVARRLRDPLHASRMDRIEAALRAVGWRLIVQVEAA